MGLLDMVRQNKVNQEKAKAFDDLQQRKREQQVYTNGANDAYSDVERRLMQRLQQEHMQQQLYEAARNQTFANQDVRGPSEPGLAQVTAQPAPNPDGERLRQLMEGDVSQRLALEELGY